MSNQINTTNGSNSTLVQISNNNVKYYEELAAQYASEAEKSVSACAVYLAAAQRCITECQNVLTEMETYISDELNLHLEDLDNPHEVTAEQTGAYTTSEVDALITEINVEMEEIEISAEAAYTHSQLTSGNPHNVTAEDIGVYTTDEVDSMLAEKQDTLIFDTAPAEGSTNPVTSGGVYSAIANIDTSSMDLSSYYTSDEVDSAISAAITEAIGEVESGSY